MPPGDSAEQKTEKATPRKRQKVREQGVVAQSSEVNNVLVLAAGGIPLEDLRMILDEISSLFWSEKGLDRVL